MLRMIETQHLLVWQWGQYMQKFPLRHIISCLDEWCNWCHSLRCRNIPQIRMSLTPLRYETFFLKMLINKIKTRSSKDDANTEKGMRIRILTLSRYQCPGEKNHDIKMRSILMALIMMWWLYLKSWVFPASWDTNESLELAWPLIIMIYGRFRKDNF